MKKLFLFLILVCLMLHFSGCSGSLETADIAATTLPVYTFTSRLCQGTGLTVTRLVTEGVSCLHDYTLQVDQMRAIEGADAIVISGAGLEEFLDDALDSSDVILDASEGLSLLDGEHHDHDHTHDHKAGHVHAEDPHIWLSPSNAKVMAHNICHGLIHLYPEHEALFTDNLSLLLQDLDALQSYGEEKLASLSCRNLITFHDGFSYFAESFHLTILHSVEEESGSEAAASELIELIGLVREYDLPAIFTEINGSDSAAGIIASETGARLYILDMVMDGDDYFEAMYRNIDTVWEALQ